ncbi:hypothetical protein FRC00_009550 [Tulasnella sp. 408]|nr:hypothetical protein FRC00_009550 [Tulasnella sp. 408]
MLCVFFFLYLSVQCASFSYIFSNPSRLSPLDFPESYHVITKFLKSTQDLEDAQAKVKSCSGGRQPAYRTTRGGNPRHTPRHNPIAKPPFHDLAASESETSSDPLLPTPTLDIAAMQTVAIQTFQNAITPQLAAMMGQLSVPNRSIAHSGATPHMNSLQVTMQPQTAVVGAAIQDAPSPLEEILGPNPFVEDTNMGGQSQE